MSRPRHRRPTRRWAWAWSVLIVGAAVSVTASVVGPLKGWSISAASSRAAGPVAAITPTVPGAAAAQRLALSRAAARQASAPAAPAASVASAASAGSSVSAGSSAPLRVVGLGDSVPAGTACECTPFVQLVAAEAGRRSGRAVTVDNFAESGVGTADVVGQLRDPGTAASVAGADLVIITVGANDLDDGALDDGSLDGAGGGPAPSLPVYQQALARQQSDLAALLDRVNALRADHQGGPGGTGGAGQVVVTGYWNVFLDGPAAEQRGASYVSGSNDLTVADNALIAAQAAAHGDLYVDLYTPFKGTGHPVDASLLAPDGDHPSAAGHQLIAVTVLAALADAAGA